MANALGQLAVPVIWLVLLVTLTPANRPATTLETVGFVAVCLAVPLVVGVVMELFE